MSHEHHHHHHECCGGHDHAGACHCHEHHHEHGTKRQLALIIATGLLLIGAVLVEKHCQLPTWQLLLIYLVPYLLIGHDTLKEAAEGIMEGDPFNEHLLMSIATLGALGIGFLPGAETQFPEAVFVMLFFQVGELCEGYAEGKSRDSIAHLMDIRPDVAHVVRNGNEAIVSPEEVATGVLPYWKGKDSNKNDVVVVGYLKRIPNAIDLPYQRTIAVDFTDEFDEKPEAASLGYKAEDYLNQVSVRNPRTSLDISFVILSQTQEYEKFASLYRVELGDTVTIEYSKVGVSAQARVTRTVYDVLKDRYKEISLGDAKIRGQSAQSAVAPVKKEVTQINSAVNALTENEASRVTLPSNFTNHGEARNFYNRKGNICMVGLDCTPSAHVSGQTLFTLPTSCRPVAALRYSVLPGVSRSSDDGGDHYVIINTDGTVTYTGTGRVFNTFTYICNGG